MRSGHLPKVNIGCGRALEPIEDGWVNCDLHPGPGIGQVFDAAADRWPFADASVREVYCSHTLEHMPSFFGFFQEAWRVLVPNGSLRVRVPYAWCSAAWWDPTHVRPWMQESFAFLQPGYSAYTRNLQQDRLGFAFWIHQVVMVFAARWARLWRRRLLRPVCKMAGDHLINVYKELQLEAWKTSEDDRMSTAFGGTRNPVVVPCAYGVMEHEMLGQPPDGLPFHRLLVFTGRSEGSAFGSEQGV